MRLPLETGINKVGLREGYSPTIDPSPFVRSFDSAIRAGEQLQGLGSQLADFASKQAAVENENYVNRQLHEFDQEKTKQVNSLLLDPDIRQKVSPSQYSAYITGKLKKFRDKQLIGMPQTRLPSFKLRTDQAILEAQVTATGHMKKVNDDNFKADTLLIKENILANIGNPSQVFDLQTGVNNYLGQLRSGELANVYTREEVVKLEQAFEEEVSRAELNRDELKLIVSGSQLDVTQPQEATPTQIDQHIQKITNSNIPAKDKGPRVESFLRSLATSARHNESRAAQMAKIIEDQTWGDMYMRMPNPELLGQDDNVVTVEELQENIDMGFVFDPEKIRKMKEDLDTYSLKMHAPEGFSDKADFENQFELLKEALLQPKVFAEDIDATLDIFAERVRQAPQTTHFIMTTEDSNALLENVSQFRKTLRDSKLALEERNVVNVRSRVKTLVIGEPLMRPFSRPEIEVLADAQNAAEMLVRAGDSPMLAADKVRDLIKREGDFATDFAAEKAKAAVIEAYKKSTRSVTDDQITVLERIIQRNIEARAQAEKQESPEDIIKQGEKKALQAK